MKAPLLVLNGPNLNLLGTREPEIYGTETLADIENRAKTRAEDHGLECVFLQTQREGELVEWIHDSIGACGAIIINAAAYSHTSIAIMDALKAVDVPVVEVHLSNIFRRESFRHHSYVSTVADAVICGMGAEGYELAVDAAVMLIAKRS
jgi:3-dehydroquinate dehydratase II